MGCCRPSIACLARSTGATGSLRQMQDKFADIDDSQSLRRESQGIFDNRDAAGGSGGAQDDEETSLVATVAQFVWFWLSCTVRWTRTRCRCALLSHAGQMPASSISLSRAWRQH
nr:hypothetical protein HK105_005191 [Polyrhizophydium stewartii]